MKIKLTTLILTLAAVCVSILCAPAATAGVVFTARIAPPMIAVFDQPPAPGDGYIWTPGYYQYGDYGYYWVPGAWVLPPAAGMLWTPGYWGNEGGRYNWHAGYWGNQVGFYGGINYGNGYFGTGFNGGRWEGGVFRHNTAVVNVDRNNVHNVYEDRAAIRVAPTNHAFNGKGGIRAVPSREEVEVGRAPHQGPTPEQNTRAAAAHDSHMAAHGAPRGR